MKGRVDANPTKYFEMWMNADRSWGTVKIMEKKTSRSSKRSKGNCVWMLPSEIETAKGKTEAADWVRALTKLAADDPENAEQYVKKHPTFHVLDTEGNSNKWKLFKVLMEDKAEFSEEETDEQIRTFEGDMSQAPAEAFKPRDADRADRQGKKKTDAGGASGSRRAEGDQGEGES